MKVKLTTAYGVYTAKVKANQTPAEAIGALIKKYAQTGQTYWTELKA